MAVTASNEKDQQQAMEIEETKKSSSSVYICGYLPGVSPEKSPILSPVPVLFPGNSWKDVCEGGCGFAMAISASGKLITWGSTDEENQIYMTCGKHGEIPEAFLLPTDAEVVKAVAGWAHCVSVTETGEVYTWGWKECVPLGKIPGDGSSWGNFQKDNNNAGRQIAGNVSPRFQGTKLIDGIDLHSDNKKDGEEIVKRRRVSVTAKEESGSSPSEDEYFTVLPSLVSLGPGVRITAVAAGGRHTLALSDMGQVWGWGYGGEGQLGLGSRVKMVSSPHLIPCTDPLPASGKDGALAAHQGPTNPSAQVSKFPGSFVKEIACGGRHSAVVTDTGALLTFGWGLYGQCGQGSTNDQLRPTFVPSLSGILVERIAAGLWHTVCITVDGRVYAFGGNQFGQLGTGGDQAEVHPTTDVETQPRLLDAPCLESKQAKMVSCGARHSAILTDDGKVFTWGWNKYGQLGLGDSIDRNIPSQVHLEGCQPKNIACGWWHTLLLAETSPES